jgi:hypothetical protein
MGQKYVRVLVAEGAVPWLVPLLAGDEPTLRAIYERLDGIFLTGGVDVGPERYGEEREALCGQTDAARDWTELTLLRWAMTIAAVLASAAACKSSTPPPVAPLPGRDGSIRGRSSTTTSRREAATGSHLAQRPHRAQLRFVASSMPRRCPSTVCTTRASSGWQTDWCPRPMHRTG